MTKINRITIHGFKSFAHKTDIPFDNKFNCILGPNGSGKSNVGDAICFVLGRLSAKSLRAEKTTNLIFNGGKDKKPSTGGTVEIAFDNSQKIFPIPDGEAVISRTITKDGSSIYRINGKKHTRTEILDLLSAARINPEGYNIVLQGDITRFVDMPTIERRKIIEEISDVSIYEEKKHKALLELQHVEEKLSNAHIILKERRIHLNELKKDRDQALKFKETKDKVDSYKATLVHAQMEDKEKARAELDKEIAQHQENIAKAEEQVKKLKEQIVFSRQKIDHINQEIEQKGEKEQVQVHRLIEDLKVNLAKEKTRVSALKDEINKIQLRKDQFKQELKELEEKGFSHSLQQKQVQENISKKKKDLEAIERSIAEFKKRHKIETSQQLEKELEEKDKLIEQKQEEIQQIRQKQQDFLREKDKLEFQVQSIDERIKKVKEVELQNKEQVKQLQSFKNDFKNATLRLNQLLDQDAGFASQVANARRKFTELQEEQAKLHAKTLSVQAGLSANQALKSILDNKKKFPGVFGTIAELGQVQKKYSLALERAAGSRMQNVVVEDDKTAAECIAYLKSNKLGTASFIPLNKIKSDDFGTEDKKLMSQKGVHDFAINLVTFKPNLKKAFNYVFGNTLVVDDIEIARKVGIGRVKMATLEGDIAEGSGVMKGGFISQKSSGGFKEKDSLEELEKVEQELEQAERIITNIQEKRDANEKEITVLRTKRGELEAEVIKLERTLHLDTADLDASHDLRKELQGQLKSVEKELENIQRHISIINHDLAELKSRKQIVRDQVTQLRDPKLQAQLSAFEESRHRCREDLVHLGGDLKTSLAHTQQLIGPEQEKIQEILKQHEKEESKFTIEIKQLGSSIDAKEKELVGREKESKEFYAKYHSLFAQREKFNAEITKAEHETENHREKIRNHEREFNLVSLKNAEIKARLAGLQEEFARYKDAQLMKNRKPEELQQDLAKMEVMLAQMSAVNLKALEIYEQVELEFGKLMGKKDGLEKEQVDVLTFMNEIETKKKEHFMKAYDQANENFQRIFSSLFKKGKAFLQLDNPKSPFEEGLSVKVKIRGNSYLDIRSLSGGEKTLTALSFIFAIQEYQPASFYILDEIDAALDKNNSETLAKLIRAYADNAQYIVISHNDSVISEADTLFGVSMNDGVSKVTSLKI